MTDEKKTNTIKPGTYPVRPLKGFATQTKDDPPKPQLCIVVRHLEGPYQGREDHWYGKLASDASCKLVAKTLRDLGNTSGDPLAPAFPESAVASAVYEEHEGKVRLEYLNRAGFVPREMDASLMDAARARLLAAMGEPAAPVVPEALRPHLAQVQRAVSVDDAAALWLQAASTLDDESRRALWGAIAARFDANKAKDAVLRLKAERAPKPAPAPTVNSMPVPDGF